MPYPYFNKPESLFDHFMTGFRRYNRRIVTCVDLPPVLTTDEQRLYGDIYRCEACAYFTDPEGVSEFASPLSKTGQTFPVSHFGDIKNALIWVVVTNPKGNRNDPNVGLPVKNYAGNRAILNDSDIGRVFQQFSSYEFATAHRSTSGRGENC